MTSNILTSNYFPHTHSINLLLTYSIAQKISDTRYFYDTKKISRSQTGISNKDFFIFYFRNNHPKSSPSISQISHFILLSYTIIYHLIYFLISYLILSYTISEHRIPLSYYPEIKVRIPPSPRL